MGDDAEHLYKLVLKADVPEDAWRTRLEWTQCFKGDTNKNFIPLLTGEQLASAAEASFAGRDDVMLLSFKVNSMEQEADLKIKYEAAESEAGGSGPFPHVYGGWIPYACLLGAPTVLELVDGKHVIPDLQLAITGTVGVETIYADEDDYDNDTSEAFDQHRYDCDDDGNDALDPS
eukprot:CAMPEP_0174719046 /NCGR_PEP_ID=MMETSP1094-20130205/30726_1 /TAXON_ID=156173 /ORGANISM="Chrysochromulina brevifilum, Strain UTEX LB 985" /LENGTH=174 /DNA_ID=CAMNT_0015919301 /DNA_START=23 /DNA_END=547 /DNA_ORIENTATION=+